MNKRQRKKLTIKLLEANGFTRNMYRIMVAIEGPNFLFEMWPELKRWPQ